ncbi:MAG: ribosome biogenesis GTPase YlqF [Eubacteriales bacterium]|nr:ribosome biogenesis GTPase YlqF [Eubacteriales bacterium]
MDVNWFPGHMAKTLREMRDQVKLVDLVIETCDARIPESSRNPELDRLLGQKPRILVLNKADLADPNQTAKWLNYYQQKNIPVLAAEGNRRASLDPLRKLIIAMNQHKIDNAKAKGRLIRPIRVMVAGIPNTGKSTIINALTGKKAAITADRPGVTRTAKWAKSGTELELLDTPGVLWPKLGSPSSQRRLAASGAIKDDVLPLEEIAMEVLFDLSHDYPELIMNRYKLEQLAIEPLTLMEDACRKRGCILSGNRLDLTRFAVLFLDELRGGKIGRITLERPER